METIEKKLEENQSLITEAESYFIASTKEVEIAKDRIRVLVMLKETIEPLRESANKTHKQCTQYISTIKKAIEGYEQAIGIYLEVLKEEARLKEEEIKKQLSEEDLPVLVNVEMPTDIKAKEEIEIEIVDKMLILQGIVSKKYPLDFADINLAKIKKWIKEGKTIEGVEVKKIPIYKFKAFKEKK